MSTNGKPTLAGCEVLPPMETAEQDRPDTSEKAAPKRKPNRRKTAERFGVLNAFVDCTAGELPRSEILVWLVLYRDTRNGIAATSQADISRRAGISDRSVRRAIGRLERRGLLKTVYRGGINRGTSKYRVFPLVETDSQRTELCPVVNGYTADISVQNLRTKLCPPSHKDP